MTTPAEHLTTVVIPVHNGSMTIAAQLDALDRQIGAPPFRLIVVDNACTDSTVEIVGAFTARCQLDVTVVVAPDLGVNRARNAGVRAADPGMVLLCDADDEVDERWVATMSAALAEADDQWVAGLLDFRRLNSAATRQLWSSAETSATTGPIPLRDTGYGANCGFHRSMWERLGGFDDRLSGHGDETEFFVRAWSTGYRLRWVSGAVVHCRQRSKPTAAVARRYRQGVSQARLTRSAEWPHAAGTVRFRSAGRGAIAATMRTMTAVVRRRPVWPAVAITALHVGRVRGLLGSRTERS